LEKAEIWALFVDPNNEGLGIGGKLHDAMVTWYFGQGKTELILGTEPGTRAEGFYLHRGWVAAGHKSNGEIIFKMSRKDLLLLS
jgi:GNAT superfamily N-acetyltransferase